MDASAGKRHQSNKQGAIVTVRVHDEFKYEGSTYEVKELMNDGMAKIAYGYDSDTTVMEMEQEKVLQLVKEFNAVNNSARKKQRST